MKTRELLSLEYWFKSFTPAKSDQFQISPAASPEIKHNTVWKIWVFMLLGWKIIKLPILTISVKGWENVLFQTLGLKGLMAPVHDRAETRYLLPWLANGAFFQVNLRALLYLLADDCVISCLVWYHPPYRVRLAPDSLQCGPEAHNRESLLGDFKPKPQTTAALRFP